MGRLLQLCKYLNYRWLVTNCRFQNIKNDFTVRATQRAVTKICDWAKYHNRHSSKSIRLTKLFFCQNDVLIGGSFWQKDNLVTFNFLNSMSIIIFSPVSNFGDQSLDLHLMFSRFLPRPARKDSKCIKAKNQMMFYCPNFPYVLSNKHKKVI